MCWCRLKECSWKFRHSKLYTLSGVYNLYIFTITPFLIKKNPRHPRRVPHSVFLPRHGPGLRTGDFHNCFAFKWFLVSESFLFEWAPNGESVVKIRIGEKKITSENKGMCNMEWHYIVYWGVDQLMCIETYVHTYNVYWDLLCEFNGSLQFKGNSIEMWKQVKRYIGFFFN